MKNRVLRFGEKVLTVVDRPVEDAAFQYDLKYLPEETVFNKPPVLNQSKLIIEKEGVFSNGR